MSIAAKFIPLLLIALLVFTEPGQRIWTSAVDWAGDRAGEWALDRAEEQRERERVRARLGEVEPMCERDFKPEGFQVSEGQAIALVAQNEKVRCDEVETEILNETWSVYVDATERGGCELSGVVDGQTAKVSDRHRDCG